MDLELSDDQQDLRDNVRTVLEGACPPTLVRSVYEQTGDAEALWAQMVELYWPALGIAEDHGGLGYGFVEVALLAEELGRAAAPGPLLATVTQLAPLLAEVDAGDLLGEVARGERTGALCIDAEVDVADGALTGRAEAVLSGSDVGCFALGAGGGLWLVEAGDAHVEARGALDPGLGLADVVFDAAPATQLAEPGPAAEAALERAAQHATVAMALHTVGACRKIFDDTLAYAKVREQYDRLIGSFQALKHRFAEMFLAVERANAVGYYAALTIAEDDPRRREATHLAKAAAGDCQRLLAEDGLQLHGGIGYTWEHDLHFWLKRAKAGELLCGSSAQHRAGLAGLLGLVDAEGRAA